MKFIARSKLSRLADYMTSKQVALIGTNVRAERRNGPLLSPLRLDGHVWL